MRKLEIARLRLYNQLITQQPYERPGDVVQWMGAVQAQDYTAAKWAPGLRLPGVTSDDIEQAFVDGAFLRTHVMRPTWHFVVPTEIRWLLKLTAPRVHAVNSYYYRKLELDDTIFRCSNDVLTKVLQGGKHLTRSELASALKLAGVATDDALRCTCILMHAELDGIICSGARRGKQFTYALLDERVPQSQALERDEALAKVASRYFSSHGPATLQDFVWWSGLTVADARAGLEMIMPQFEREIVDGRTYWFSASMSPTEALSQRAYLLPDFDEYMVGYTDRSAIFDASHREKLKPRIDILSNCTMILDGQIVGTWMRALKKDAVILTANLFTELNEAERYAFAVATERYGAFVERSVNAPFQAE